jgi:putative transposase
LTVTDEGTRDRLAIEVATSIQARRVMAVLAQVVQARGAPAYLWSDTGPEFVAQAVHRWVQAHHVQTAYIMPGSPWQNGYAESFNRRVRDAWLKVEWFRNVHEARVVMGSWRR